MPVYQITDPETGKVIKVTANRQPTQEEALQIFAEQQQIPEQIQRQTGRNTQNALIRRLLSKQSLFRFLCTSTYSIRSS